jgi:hypothetical protein
MYYSSKKVSELQWATTLLNRSMSRLREEFVVRGKEEQFEAIKIFLTGEKKTSYGELATRLGTSEAAVMMGVSRMRQRYIKLLREEIAKMAANSAEIEDELRAWLATLSS